MRKQNAFLAVFVGIVLVFFGYWTLSQIFFSGISQNNSLQQQQIADNLSSRTSPIFETQPASQPISWLNSTGSSTASSNTSGALLQNYSNVTNNIATDLSNEFIVKYSSGQNIATSSINELIDKYASSGRYTGTTTLEFDKPIDDSKLNISQDNSNSAKQTYFNNVGALMIANLQYISESTMQEAIADVFEKDDYGMAQKIADTNYQVVDKLATISVPASLLQLHKKVLQSFDNIAYFFTLMVNYKNDPVKFMAAVNYFPQVIQEGQNISTQLSQAISASSSN